MLRQVLRRAPRVQPNLRTPCQPFTRSYAGEPPHATAQTRIERFNRRLPKFLHRYTNALGTAPLTHITAFLLLHEITAVIPLLGLAATFHYTQWLPSWFAEGAWVLQGVEMFGRYFRRKGWIRSEDAAEAKQEAELEMRRRDRAWNLGEGGARVVVEFATAYAVTKVLLPLRIIVSVWGTPWFAKRAVIPVSNLVKRIFGRGAPKTVPGSRAAGTGATEAGATSKITLDRTKKS